MGGQDQLVPKPVEKEKINVYYGGNGGEFDVTPGQTVKDILASSDVRDSCGYSSLTDENTIVVLDGEEVPRAEWDKRKVVKGQTVEVLKRAGQKA